MNRKSSNSRCYSAVTYSYTDAGNYKFYGEFFLSDLLSVKDVSDYLIHGQFFIPIKIGLPSLVPQRKNSDDHLLHEFVSSVHTDSEPNGCLMGKKNFVNLIRTANNMGWFRDLTLRELYY
jgi:hypothetical protein